MRWVLPLVVLALSANNPLSAQGEAVFDHSAFDALLGAHVSEDGLVDYSGFFDSPEFQRYLTSLAVADPDTLSGPEGLAFWINSYNAYTIELINRHQEKKSIRNINKALGCPPLLPKAFTGAGLEEQLDGRVRVFLLESPGKNRVVPEEGMVHLSPIFDWYRENFPPGNPGLGTFLAQYYPPGPERTLLESGQFLVNHTDYDWRLNAQALKQPGSGNSSVPGRIPF